MVKLLRLTLLALLAFPAAAQAADVSMVARAVPLDGRSLQASAAPMHFNMVGLHWRGSGSVRYRTHPIGGAWTPWLAADAHPRPALRPPERIESRAWHDGTPAWTGPSDRIQFRTEGSVARL